jgi:hypothetical protein
MPKSSKKPDEMPPPPPESEQPAADPLATLLDSLSTDADDLRASVFDLSGDAPEWIANYRAEEITTERIAADLGGGVYRVQIRDPRGVYRGQTMIRISRRFPRPATIGAAAPAPITPPPPQNDPMREVLTAMIAAQGQIVAALAAKPPPPPAPIPPPPPPLSDAIMLELLRRNTPARTESRSAELRELIELAKELGGGGGQSEPDALPPGAFDLIGKMLAAPGAASPPAQPPPPPRTAEPATDAAAARLVGRLSLMLELTTAANSESMIDAAAREIIAARIPIEVIATMLAGELAALSPERAATASELAARVVDRVETLSQGK